MSTHNTAHAAHGTPARGGKTNPVATGPRHGGGLSAAEIRQIVLDTLG